MSVAPPGGQDRIMIYGPKSDGTYIIEFRMADGESLAISVPAKANDERTAYASQVNAAQVYASVGETARAPMSGARALGIHVAERLLARGAKELLEEAERQNSHQSPVTSLQSAKLTDD